MKVHDLASREYSQNHLAEILDRLGPGLTLDVDHVCTIAFFGRDDTVAEANKFAKQHQCGFRRRDGPPDEILGTFFRAYAKLEDS